MVVMVITTIMINTRMLLMRMTVKMMQMLTIVNGMIIRMITTVMITENMIAMPSLRCVAIAVYRQS